MMSENAKKVLNYLKDNYSLNLTSADVAEALNLGKKSVDAIFNSFTKEGKDLGFRQEGEIELENGMHQGVKYLRLTRKGMDFDPDAPENA